MRKKPSLLSMAGVAFALLASPALAQQPAPRAPAPDSESDALTDKARQLFEEGVKAANASRWSDAHASFLAAWRLKEHYQIASNLGVAELKLGKYREAAEHLTWYLREAPETKVEQRRRAEAWLKEALPKVASVTVQVEPAGAEVTVDGALVGKAPLTLPVFLDPGQHEIRARLDGHVPEKRAVTARAGQTETVSLRLVARAVEVGGAGNGVAIGPGTPAMPRETGGPSKPVLYTGMALAGVAAGVGAVFGIMSLSKESAADDIYSRLKEKDGPYFCAGKLGVTNATDCRTLKSNREDAWLYTKIAWGGFGGAAVLGAATLVYYWTALPRAESKAHVQVFPNVAAGGGGIVVSGAW
ncbi:PEGA domain-containing protein [Sorangium sp. So ce131]|uniref:PEGA domain-containing protein n=1 Tax=Sorangium sp. So ce131 TaxID=3133282 RepID=UPI003F639489